MEKEAEDGSVIVEEKISEYYKFLLEKMCKHDVF